MLQCSTAAFGFRPAVLLFQSQQHQHGAGRTPSAVERKLERLTGRTILEVDAPLSWRASSLEAILCDVMLSIGAVLAGSRGAARPFPAEQPPAEKPNQPQPGWLTSGQMAQTPRTRIQRAGKQRQRILTLTMASHKMTNLVLKRCLADPGPRSSSGSCPTSESHRSRLTY